MTRQSGERLTHEEVINKLDNETVSYGASLGIGDQFCETLRVSLKVETPMYETAIAWLRDLVYGGEFDKERRVILDLCIMQSCTEVLGVVGKVTGHCCKNSAITSGTQARWQQRLVICLGKYVVCR